MTAGRHRHRDRPRERTQVAGKRDVRRRAGVAVDLGDVRRDVDGRVEQRLQRRVHRRDDQVGAHQQPRRGLDDVRPRRRPRLDQRVGRDAESAFETVECDLCDASRRGDVVEIAHEAGHAGVRVRLDEHVLDGRHRAAAGCGGEREREVGANQPRQRVRRHRIRSGGRARAHARGGAACVSRRRSTRDDDGERTDDRALSARREVVQVHGSPFPGGGYECASVPLRRRRSRRSAAGSDEARAGPRAHPVPTASAHHRGIPCRGGTGPAGSSFRPWQPTPPDRKEPNHAFRHRARSHLSRLRTARPHGDPAKAQRATGRRPADPHSRARPLLPEGAPAASGARRVLPEDRGRLHADRHDLDGRAPHEPGVPCIGRRAVAVPLRPGAHGPAGPRHPGVHRPRARPDDPAHARAQAGARRPQRLQRLLVLGPAVGRGSPPATCAR